jgi:zinc/manganese transport system substrate-binding protein
MIPTPAGAGRRLHVGLAAGVLAVAACGGEDDGTAAGADEGPYVVATTSIWADLVQQVACDGTFEVRTLLPTGADSHGYEPSLHDREALDGAALVVANGLGLEERLDDTLTEVEDGGVPLVRIGDHVETLDGDPHVWFDPTRTSTALPVIGEALVAAGGDGKRIGACVTEAQDALAELDAEVAATLDAVPADRRVLVTNHDSLGYFADRYDFTVLGSILPSTSTLTEASPGQLEDLGDTIAAEGVPAIFTDTTGSADDAEALAERLGVEVLELHTESLGEPGSGVETYADLMRFDARAIADALGS